MGRKWLEAEEKALRALIKDGATPITIGKTLGRSAEAVRDKTRAMGLGKKYTRSKQRSLVKAPRAWKQNWDEARSAEMLEMLADGNSRDEIGHRLGLVGDCVKLAFVYNGMGAEYTAAMHQRRKRNCGRPPNNVAEWNESKNTAACAELLRRQLESGIHWLPEKVAA